MTLGSGEDLTPEEIRLMEELDDELIPVDSPEGLDNDGLDMNALEKFDETSLDDDLPNNNLAIPPKLSRAIFTRYANGATLEQRRSIFTAYQQFKAQMDADSFIGLLRTITPLVSDEQELANLRLQLNLVLEQKDTELDTMRRAREIMYRHWVATILTPVVGLVDGTFEMAVVMVAEILESVSFGITHIPRRFLQGLKRGSSTESFDIGGFFDRK